MIIVCEQGFPRLFGLQRLLTLGRDLGSFLRDGHTTIGIHCCAGGKVLGELLLFLCQRPIFQLSVKNFGSLCQDGILLCLLDCIVNLVVDCT